MKKLTILYLTIVVSLLFMLMPESTDKNRILVGFKFSEMTVSLEYYAYSIFQFLATAMLVFVLTMEEKVYKTALWIFLGLTIADAIDWVVCYNEIWFYVGNFPISMNVLKCVIFGFVILYEWIKSLVNQ